MPEPTEVKTIKNGIQQYCQTPFQKNMYKHNLSNLSLLLLLGLIWGSGYVISKYCVTHGVMPLGYAFWQSLGPAIALIIIGIFRKVPSIRFEKKYLGYYLVCGILGIAIPNTLIYFTAQHLPAGIIGVVVNVVPILVYPIALLCKQEIFKGWRILGVLLGIIGVMMIVIPHTNFTTDAGIPWIILILLTPICFACCAVFIAMYRPVPSDSLGLSTGMLIVSSLVLTPIVFSQHAFYGFQWPFTIPNDLIVLETILSTTGYVIFFLLIKRAGPVYYSLVSGVVALTSLFWGWIIFHETLNLLTTFAVVLILMAIGIMTWVSHRH